MLATNNHTAIILAGGQSSRMGEDKGLMLLDGKPMIQYILDTISTLTKHIIIISNNIAYEKFGFPVYEDVVKGKGPLAGIITGLSNTKTEKNWILSCDVPYVQADLLIKLMEQLENFDAVIPSKDQKEHPLIATYNTATLKPLKEQLDLNNLKLKIAHKAIKINQFNADIYNADNFKNINSKKDL